MSEGTITRWVTAALVLILLLIIVCAAVEIFGPNVGDRKGMPIVSDCLQPSYCASTTTTAYAATATAKASIPAWWPFGH